MIWAIVADFVAGAWREIVMAVGGLFAAFAAYRSGVNKERRKQAEKYTATRKRMDEIDEPDSVAAAREWLRDRSER